jgi:diguanylate cyclase (GGDEF)-like protein/PAS domain S-box-containing protein
LVRLHATHDAGGAALGHNARRTDATSGPMPPVPAPLRQRLTRLSLLVLLWGASLPWPAAAQDATPAALRHPIEDRALVEPERVLAELPALLDAAQAADDTRTRTLLLLAKANACRVIADLHCQREAGAQARQAAAQTGEVGLEVRGLIVEGRAHMALQDYSQGERLLGDAELRLRDGPDPVLAADIDLGYSSMSHALGKHALAAQYAERGLARLGPDDDPPLQVRLLRNHARALTQLRRSEEAGVVLDRGLAISRRVADPKLTAELFLEKARLARRLRDAAGQKQNAAEVIALGEQLRNSQLAGLGFEVLGLAAADARDWNEAERQLREAIGRFRALDLSRDERRVTRALLDVLIEADRPASAWEALLRRYLEIEREVLEADRAQAADDFDARLKYAQQENQVLRLESEARLAQARELSLAATNRLTIWLNVFAGLTVLLLAVFFGLQRRSNRRLQAAVNALRESESRAMDLLRLSTGLVFLHDTEGRLLMMNPAAAEALGSSSQDMVGRDVREFLPEDGRAPFEQYLRRVADGGEAHGTLKVKRLDGGERYWRYGNRLSLSGTGQRYVVGHAVDVTEQLAEAERLRERSERDALTGAYNRRYLEEFERGQGEAGRWAVVNVDLDHFKQVNDTHGHEFGDRVLIGIAQFLQQRVREGDAVVRSGGDEFLLLIGGAGEATLELLIERLLLDAHRAPCAFSLGWSLREGRETLAETLARADRAMYERRARKRSTPG